MNAKEAIAKGYQVYCLGCSTIYRTPPTRQYEDGHGGRQLPMCKCGSDLFGSLVSYEAEAAEGK
ncbi:hypothetical protein LCGC14_1204700 [marine sediment metagenome]|uniref:Uncharacterized protein n=1 Tax=marine sediment metagenome TaxID=412755 RepID=A0A0F9NYA0_9ZZZZ